MSGLLREIKKQSEAAAAVLESAGLHTDSDIQMLTIEDLRELFPGHEKIKLRRTIFEIIHKQKPVDLILKELKAFIPHESFRAALTNNGVLADYLRILKDMKTQMNHVQSFLDAHVCLLEGFSTNQPDQQSATCGPDPVSHNGQRDGRQQGAPGEVMSRFLREIKHQNEAAADVLEMAGVHTDSDIQMLTKEDLSELFPGHLNIKLRRTIFEIIHKQKPVDQLLKELKAFIPHESFRAALTNDGVLVDYLPILKDMKTQMNRVQSFLDAHISLLEEFSTNQPDQQSATCGPDPVSHNGQRDGRQQGAPDSLQGPSTSDASGEMKPHTGPTGGYPQGPQSTSTSATDGQVKSRNGQSDGDLQGARGPSTSATDGQVQSLSGQTQVGPQGARGPSTSATDDPMESHHGQTDCGPQGARGPSTSATDGQAQSLNGQTEVGPQGARAKLYRTVLGGKTFGAHLKLMEKVKDRVQIQLQPAESNQDHDITFLFCPICSRVASDVEAAMTHVKDDKPVILVLMHHTREVKYTSSMKTWHEDSKVVLFVNVFYHETIQGLLKCEENNVAVSKIQNELLGRFFPRSTDSRGNPQGSGAGGSTGNTSGSGGNYRGSDGGSRSSGRSMWTSAFWRSQHS